MQSQTSLAGLALLVLALGPASQTLWAADGPYAVQDAGPSKGAGFALNAAGDVAGTTSTAPQDAFVTFFGGGPQILAGLGTSDSIAYGLHGDGWAVGSSRVNFFMRPVRYQSGAAQLLSWPGPLDPDGPMGEARAVNNAGVIAGTVNVGGTKAAIWNGSATASLPESMYSEGYAINNSGVVTGRSFDMAAMALVAFRWSTSAGTVTPLASLGGPTSEGHGINDAGDVVGDSIVKGTANELAVLWPASGGIVEIGSLGGTESSARDINNHGQVVGYAKNASGEYRAFLWEGEGSGMVDLNTLLPAESGWVLLSANAINDAGQIAGEGIYQTERRAFLLTPPDTKDTTAPVISAVDTTPNAIWPPKHQMVDVSVTVWATDDSGETPTCRVTGVTSSDANNAAGDGNTSDDVELVSETAVRVRAERSGPTGSRVYTVAVECADGSGNVATGAGTVVIGETATATAAKAKKK
jgi:probable HAF family extracellular repeat protein